MADVHYEPFKCSYALNDNLMHQLGFIRKRHGIPMETDVFDKYPSTMSFNFEKENPGTIMNTFEHLVLTSMWDVREDQDYSTIVVGRGHMFYTADGVPLAYTNEYGKKDEDIVVKIEPKNIHPFSFLNEVDSVLIKDFQRDDLYDGLTYSYYASENQEPNSNELEKKLNRNNVRKISENHFVISGYNLLYQEIKINDDIPNSVVPKGNFSKFAADIKNSIVSIYDITKGQVKKSVNTFLNTYMKSVSVEVPDFLFDGPNDSLDVNHTAMIIEFLSNSLIKQIEYCYSGKIFMKYNPKIEIGDTISLLDNLTGTYGVFKVDSFEHSLDTRGLITVANVKAFWEFKDPILDVYSYKIGNELLEDLGNEIERVVSTDDKEVMLPKNKTIQNIMESYFKYLLQSPKYTMLFHFTSGLIFDEISPENYHNFTPTPVPLKFMPMMHRGKIKIPENLKCVFFSNLQHNYSAFFSTINRSIYIFINNAGKAFARKSMYVLGWVTDFLVSFFTMGLHELIKPWLGITQTKAMNTVFGDKLNNAVVRGEIESMQTYNPYTGITNNASDFGVCFFNINMREEDDASKNEDIIDKSIKGKEEIMSSIINDKGYNLALLVELYDSYNHKGYTYKEFLNKFNTTYEVVREGKQSYIGGGSPFKLNSYTIDAQTTTEYGATIFHPNKNSDFDIKTRTLPIALDGFRVAMETTITYAKVEEKPKDDKWKWKSGNAKNYKTEPDEAWKEQSKRDRSFMKTVKIIWFHNIYGSKGEESLMTRQSNMKAILDFCTKEYNSFIDNKEAEQCGYIIMADCNLEVVNKGQDPKYTSKGAINEYIILNKEHPFVQKITRATTLSKKSGLADSKLYDNVLVSDNLLNYVNVGRMDYVHEHKSLISDHVPVYVNIRFSDLIGKP